MIKKFRIRFIAVAMASIFVVLAVILGVMNVVNYRRVVREADNTLQILMENDGKFPEQQPGDNPAKKAEEENDSETDVLENNTSTDNIDEKKQSPPEKPEDDNEDDSEKGDSGNNSPEMNGTDKNDEPRMSPELPFESRYFTVVLDSDNKKVSADIGKIAAVNEKTAVKYAKTVAKKSKTSGFYSGYRYMVDETNGEKMIIFLDTGRNLGTFYSFLITSIAASFGGMLAVLILVIVLSKRIVKPVIESYEKQKRFITDASHEIKTPLTIIDANTEVIEMMEGENEWTSSTRKQVARLTSLTEKLVFLSRMDEEATKLEMLEFSLTDAILDTAEPFKTVARTKGKKLTIDVTDGILYTGDEKTIRQLVSILLDNAMKYSGCSSAGFEKGNINKTNLNKTKLNKTNSNKTTQMQNDCVTTIDPAPEIELTMRPSGKTRIITVWNTVDETANIKKGRQDMLFERFYRTDTSHNSKTGGFGIGLSAAYAIVKAHKGKITAESKDGRSIKFTIVL